jgi:hypothetical protein
MLEHTFFGGFITFPDFLTKLFTQALTFSIHIEIITRKSFNLQKRHTITQGHALYCVWKGHMYANELSKKK